MRRVFLLLLFSVVFSGQVIAQEGEERVHQFGEFSLRAVEEGSEERPVKASQWTKEAKLWLARSCVGEAGFGALEECSGIAWVYAVRAEKSGHNFVDLVRKYSAALREDNRPSRRWILGLELDGRCPEHWPKHLKWGVHRRLWKFMLAMLDMWAQGKIANPVESADHYGGRMDVPSKKWERIHPVSFVVFRNRFYRSS